MQEEFDRQEGRPDEFSESRTEQLLSQLEQLVVQARQLPFSNQRVIDPNEALVLIGQLRDQLPAELRQARWILDHNQRTVDDAKLEAERIVQEAEISISRMLDEHEVTLRAEYYAEDVVLSAEESAAKIRERGTSYLDGHLERVETTLEHLLAEIRQDRAELHNDDY